MRPESMRHFDRAFLAMLALSLLNLVLTFSSSQAALAASGLDWRYGLPIIFLSYGIYALLWFFTSRRASNVAKWILVIFCVIAVLSFLFQLVSRQVPADISGLLPMLSLVAFVAAVWMLFRPDARDWFAGRGPVDPEIFR